MEQFVSFKVRFKNITTLLKGSDIVVVQTMAGERIKPYKETLYLTLNSPD